MLSRTHSRDGLPRVASVFELGARLAGGSIKAGDDRACFAGLRIRVAWWPLYAKVTAKTKPAHLFGGYWIGKEGDEQDLR